MKDWRVKTGIKSVLLSALLYVLLLALVTALTLRGILMEEQIGSACILCAMLAAFAAALVCRLVRKDADFLFSALCAGGFFLLVLLLAFLLGGEFSLSRVLVSLVAVSAAIAAANVLYAKSGMGKKKRGRRRAANR